MIQYGSIRFGAIRRNSNQIRQVGYVANQFYMIREDWSRVDAICRDSTRFNKIWKQLDAIPWRDSNVIY